MSLILSFRLYVRHALSYLVPEVSIKLEVCALIIKWSLTISLTKMVRVPCKSNGYIRQRIWAPKKRIWAKIS